MDDLRRLLREWAKDVVRGVASVPIRDTDYVPRFKRRVDACIDRAAVLQAIEHAEILDRLAAAESQREALRKAAKAVVDAVDRNLDTKEQPYRYLVPWRVITDLRAALKEPR